MTNFPRMEERMQKSIQHSLITDFEIEGNRSSEWKSTRAEPRSSRRDVHIGILRLRAIQSYGTKTFYSNNLD